MIFSDTLARSRQHLEVGTSLLVTVDAEMREDELRFTGQIIEPLEAAVAGKVRELVVEVEASEVVQRLHDVLESATSGLVQVKLKAQLPGGVISEIELPKRYTLPSDLASQLQKSAGYIRHSEG